MEVERTDGITQAIRCIDAMDGQDDATRLSLWRAALRYNERDRMSRTQGRDFLHPAQMRVPGEAAAHVGME